MSRERLCVMSIKWKVVVRVRVRTTVPLPDCTSVGEVSMKHASTHPDLGKLVGVTARAEGGFHAGFERYLWETATPEANDSTAPTIGKGIVRSRLGEPTSSYVTRNYEVYSVTRECDWEPPHSCEEPTYCGECGQLIE